MSIGTLADGFRVYDSAHLTKTKFRLSLSSTDLSEEAQGRLVEPLATTNLFCWTPVACAVLSANDLLRSRDSDPKYSLASILVVALTIWRLKTPQLSFDERKAEWNRTVDLLKAGSSPLLKASFYNDVELVCTDEAAIGDDDFHGFDDELEAYGGPDGGHISAAFIEVRDYRVRNELNLRGCLSRRSLTFSFLCCSSPRMVDATLPDHALRLQVTSTSVTRPPLQLTPFQNVASPLDLARKSEARKLPPFFAPLCYSYLTQTLA